MEHTEKYIGPRLTQMELRPLCFASSTDFFAPALLKVGRSVSTSSENLQMTSQSSGFGGLFCLSFAFHILRLNNDADSSEEETHI